MSETKTKGFLIYRQDFQLFDEIISFINEHGNIFTNVALGTEKILSKNSRNLFYGCLSEFIFFSSRDIDNKLGKLKKVNLLENNIHISTRTPLILLSSIIYKNKIKGISIYNEIVILTKLLKDYDKSYDEILNINILIKVTKFLGIKLNLNGCNSCNNREIYSFCNDNYGFVCKKHFISDYKIDSSAIKLIYLVSKNRFDLANKYSEVSKSIVIKMLVYYINYHIGFNLYNYLFS